MNIRGEQNREGFIRGDCQLFTGCTCSDFDELIVESQFESRYESSRGYVCEIISIGSGEQGSGRELEEKLR